MGECMTGKRKFKELEEIMKVGGKDAEETTKTAEKTIDAEKNQISNETQKEKLIKEEIVQLSDTCGQPSSELKINPAMESGAKDSPSKGKKLKILHHNDTENIVDPSLLGPPRRPAGCPPKPRRQIVQALLCEKKRKFEDFEPLVEEFVNEVTLDLHKWIAEKRQEILHKFKKFKYRAFFGEEGLDTGPNQSPEAP